MQEQPLALSGCLDALISSIAERKGTTVQVLIGSWIVAGLTAETKVEETTPCKPPRNSGAPRVNGKFAKRTESPSTVPESQPETSPKNSHRRAPAANKAVRRKPAARQSPEQSE